MPCPISTHLLRRFRSFCLGSLIFFLLPSYLISHRLASEVDSKAIRFQNSLYQAGVYGYMKSKTTHFLLVSTLNGFQQTEL